MERAERALDNMWQDAHSRAKCFKDPPPADMEPDPDYKPEVGEWFWWWSCYTGGWFLYHRQSDTRVVNYDGDEQVEMGHHVEDVYKGKMLPAIGPEADEGDRADVEPCTELPF